MSLHGQVLLGLYIGALTGVFTAFLTFLLSFGFKYVAGVTFPSRMSLLLGLGVAGFQGSLYGLMRDPTLITSPAILTALLVVLLVTLYAHKRGKDVAKATPKGVIRRFRPRRLSPDAIRHIGRFGRVRVSVAGTVEDMEGYPPLPDDVRGSIARERWWLPADLPVPELERRVAESLTTTYGLDDVAVSVDAKGRAAVVAAPPTSGLSRRVPVGREAVAVDALLPAGLDRGDEVALEAGGETVEGTVLSAGIRPDGPAPAAPGDDWNDADDTDDGEIGDTPPVAPARGGAGRGGRGRVTVAVAPGDVAALTERDVTKLVAESRGRAVEFELASLLRRGDTRFRKVTVAADSPVVGETLGELDLRDTRGVVVLALKQFDSWAFAPDNDRGLRVGDELFVAGPEPNLDGFASGRAP